MGIEKPIAIEKETAVVDGIDVSGAWNRMFEQRVIWDYDATKMEEITAFEGAESLSWCYECGKCVAVCPVDIVGNYGPRKIHHKVKVGMDLLDNPDLWLCTTCMNCLRVCPKEVDMIKIMPAVREQAILQGKPIPDELQKTFDNIAKYGNPQGESPRKRADWVKDAGVPVPVLPQIKKPVDVLWYVGSYPSYHARGKDAARSMARILHVLGVDYGILGHEEKEDGDSVRLAGEKGLFEMLAEENIKVFGKYSFNKMVVTGPHEYNAFLHEYPKYGGTYTYCITHSSSPSG